MGAVRALADAYVADGHPLDPCVATGLGVPGFDHLLTDHSSDGVAERVALARRTLTALDGTPPDDEPDRRCAALLRDRLTLELDRFDAGEHLRPLRIIGSPVQTLRSCFDLMSLGDDSAWEQAAHRLEAVPAAYEQLRAALAEGLRQRVLAAPRQALACADQLAIWAGAAPGRASWFAGFAAAGPPSLRARLDSAVANADHAVGDLARWLRQTYAVAAEQQPDAVGPDAYALGARQFLGARLDVDEAYDWAWEELRRIEDEMVGVAARIVPGGTVDEAMRHLETAGEALDDARALQSYLQRLIDDTIHELGRDAFAIAEPLRRCEAMLAPAGSASAQYYTGPSLDFSRPGRTWNPVEGRTRFPVWSEVSTCYHEAVPGHHLQLAQWIYRAPQLSVYQTTAFVAGNGEGWALYAERLMDERGALADPGHRMGYLVAQQMRATRVIVDLGMHHGLACPTGQPFHPGEPMTPQLGRDFLFAHAGRDQAFLGSEWVRYLGWPGQAISYKLGERVWLAGREAARRRAAVQGRPFDLRGWHAQALDLGSMGLDLLADELPMLG